MLRGPRGEWIHVTPEGASGDAVWQRGRHGRGWRLTAEPVGGGDPLLWLVPGRLRWGGRLVVAPDREYVLGSRLLRILD